MKYLTFFIYLIAVCIIGACGNSEEKSQAYFDSDDEFTELVKSLNEQFSDNAGYSSIMLSYDDLMGNTVLVKVSRNIDENTIEEWFFMNDSWDKKAETKLELGDKNPADFLFSLNGDYDLSKLLDMVNESKHKVMNELKVKEVVCKSVNLLMPRKRSSVNKMDDLITQIAIEPLSGGTTYKHSYDAMGNLKN